MAPTLFLSTGIHCDERSMSSKGGIAGSKGSEEAGIEETTTGGKGYVNEKRIKEQGRRKSFLWRRELRAGCAIIIF